MSFDPGYRQQLLERYPEQIVDQVTTLPHHAPLHHQGDFTIPYVRVEPEVPQVGRTILYVPGFGEGIVNKASFAAELAVRGARVILPGQNRQKIVHDAIEGRGGVHNQALNYLAVLESALANDEDQSVDVVSHSYGALILQEMVRLAPDRFSHSHLVFLAPAGSIHDETRVDLSRRWISTVRSEMNQHRPASVPDRKRVTAKASAITLLANMPRMRHEIDDLVRLRVDYVGLVQKVGALSVISYAEDKMFPDDRMAPTLSEAVRAGVTWLTPCASSEVLAGRMKYGGDGAVHDDEQYNPARVAAPLMQLLAEPLASEAPTLLEPLLLPEMQLRPTTAIRQLA